MELVDGPIAHVAQLPPSLAADRLAEKAPLYRRVPCVQQTEIAHEREHHVEMVSLADVVGASGPLGPGLRKLAALKAVQAIPAATSESLCSRGGGPIIVVPAQVGGRAWPRRQVWRRPSAVIWGRTGPTTAAASHGCAPGRARLLLIERIGSAGVHMIQVSRHTSEEDG